MAFVINLATNDGSRPFRTGLFGPGGYPSGVDNDGGNIRAAGTVPGDGTLTGLVSTNPLGEGNPIITIVSGASLASPTKGITAGTFNAGNAQVLERVTDTIASISNTTLLHGSSNSANNGTGVLGNKSQQRQYFYKTAVRNGGWNIFSGVFSPAVTSSYSGVWNISAGVDNSATMRTSGTDVAAYPTQDVPGRLTFMYGNPTPSGTLYGPRYNW